MKLPFRHARPRAERPSAGSGDKGRSLLRLRSAAGQVFMLQVVLVLLLVAAAVTAQLVQAQRDGTSRAREKSVAAAQAFAHAPGVAEAMQGPHPAKELQPRTEAARKDAGVDFIVLMNRKGIRYTQPDPSLIGKRFSRHHRALAPGPHHRGEGHRSPHRRGHRFRPGGGARAGLRRHHRRHVVGRARHQQRHRRAQPAASDHPRCRGGGPRGRHRRDRPGVQTAAASDARPRADGDDTDVRAPRRGPARGTGGRAHPRTRRAPDTGQRRGAPPAGSAHAAPSADT